jgi:ketosteroid isomerase-like protein
MTDDEVLQLADRVFSAIEDGDLEALRACYAPEMVSWTNFDDRESDLEQALKVVGWLCSRLSDRRYDVRRRILVDGGFVQEHVLCGTAPDGTEIAMPACIVATVADGAVLRMNEYLDPAGVAALAR